VLLLAGAGFLAVMTPSTSFTADVAVVDDLGQSADEFVHAAYVAMIENRYESVQDRFNPPYLEYIRRDSGSLEKFFESKIGAWRVDLLSTSRKRKQYRPDMPRIRAFQDDGKGSAGVINDVLLINGRWAFVLWSNFQK
jgi:hypothetical protein